MLRDLLVLTASYFLVMLFAAAALHKLVDRAGFVRIVQDYQVLPAPLARPVSLAVILAELIIAAALVVPGFQAAGALLAATLLILYAGAIGLNLARGRRRIDCGCSWGRTGGGLSHRLILRNLVLAGLAVVLVIIGRASGASLFIHLNAMVGAATVWALYSTLDLLTSNTVGTLAKEGRHD